MKNTDLDIRNARIEGTMLGFEDHGILTFTLDLDYGGTHQGAGGYGLSGEKGQQLGMAAIAELLKILDVDRWERLRGTYCRVYCRDGRVEGIGHVLDDSAWFNFREHFAQAAEQ